MKKLYIIFLFILAFNVSYAFILPEEEIKKIARDLDEKNNGEYTCYSKGRTITFEYFLKSFEDFKRFNQNSNVLVGNLDDDIAGICSSNFINLNYIVHYKKPDGSTSTKMSFLSPTDLLGFKGANKERISLLNHNKSRGVNISLLKPKGWIIEEGDRPHIVQKYINPGRTTIYMVQINELPTFVSRNEVESELNDDSFGWNEMISNEIFNSSSDVKIISMDNDLVDRYPAKSYTYTALVDMKGLKVSMFAKTWYVFYEDRLVILWGLTMFPEDKEEQIKFELLFDIITNQVQFPEQYIETSYER